MPPLLTSERIDTYRRDGGVVPRGLLAERIETIRTGIERDIAEPGPFAADNVRQGEGGRFLDDGCNRTRPPELESVIRDSPAAAVAAELMGPSAFGADLPRPRPRRGTGHRDPVHRLA